MSLEGVRPYPKSEQTSARRDPKRTRPSDRRMREMRDAKQGPCRLCGSPEPNSLHHVIPRSAGLGAWSESNLTPLCGTGTTGCHGLIEARNPAACKSLASRLTDAEYAYVVHHMGEGWIERRYGVRYERAAVAALPPEGAA